MSTKRCRLSFAFRFALHVSLAWLALGRKAWADDPVVLGRWAIVTVDPALADVGAMLTAELSRVNGVTLVERDDLQRVLGELQLTAAGLVDPEQSLRLGQTLAAEALLLVDVAGENKSLARARLVETRTGVRLWDWVGPRQRPDQQAATLATELQQARDTLRVADERRHYVGVIGIHSEEVGGVLNPVTQALNALLEFDLQRLPGVVVLEREQQGRLQKEKELTGLEQKLRGSALLLEGGLRRDGDGCVVTLRRTALAASTTQDFRVEAPSQKVDELRDRIRETLPKVLGAAAPKSTATPQQEAVALLARQNRLRAAGRHDDTVGLVEAALALDPSEDNRRTLQLTLDGSVRQHNNSARGRMDKELRDAELLTALRSAIRLAEVDIASLRAKQTQNPATLQIFVDYAFRPELDFPNDGEPEENQRVRAELDRLRLEKQRLLLDIQRDTRQRMTLEAERIERAAYFSDNPETFCRTVESAVVEFDKAHRIHGASMGDQVQLFRALLSAFKQSHSTSQSSSWTDLDRKWPLDKLAPLYRTLSRYENGVIRQAGLAAVMKLPGDEGLAAATELLRLTLAPSADPQLAMQQFEIRVSAINQLKQAGKGQEQYDAMLASARDARSPQETLHRLGIAWEFLFFDRRFTAEAYQRFITVLDEQVYEGPLTLRAATLRQSALDRLSKLAPQVATQYAARLPGAWAEYAQTEIKIEKPVGCGQLLTLALDRSPTAKQQDEELVLAYLRTGKQAAVGRASIRGGRVRLVADVPLQLPTPGRLHFTLAPDKTFLVSATTEIALLSGRDVRLFGPREGAPGNAVFSSAWLDGALYLVYLGAIAKLEPDQGRFTLLASSAALQKNSPLDGKIGFISDLLAVPDSGSLLIGLSFGGEMSGVWKYTPRTNQWERIVRLREGGFLSAFWREEQKVCFRGEPVDPLPDERGVVALPESTALGQAWLSFDTRENKVSRVTTWPPLVARQPGRVDPHYVRVGEHLIVSNGTLYTPGGEFTHPQANRWTIIEPYQRGFLAVTLDSNGEVIRRFERTATQPDIQSPRGEMKPSASRVTIQGPAVRLDKSGGIELTGTKGLVGGNRPFTVEFWARLAEGSQTHTLLSDFIRQGNEDRGWLLQCPGFGTDQRSATGYKGAINVGLLWLDTRRWFHLAICSDGRRRTQVFQNGEPVFSLVLDKFWLPDSTLNLHLGAHDQALPPFRDGFHGDVRALRISSTARYLYNFQPPRTFEKDAQTEVLLDFSKPTGTTIPDLSGHERHGRIFGATWLAAEGSPVAAETPPQAVPPSTLTK